MRVLIYDSQATYYAQHLAGLGQIDTAETPQEALQKIATAEVLVALAPRITGQMLDAGRNLKWVQALTTGVDNLLPYNGFALTNCHGIHGPQMAELGVMLILASLRRFGRMLMNQRMSVWDRWPQPLLRGRTACIVGVGDISETLARLLRGFGMQVTGVTSRSDVDGFDRLYPRSRIHEAVAGAHIVVVLTPYTPQTRHIIDAGVIASMRSDAHLVNLSRGGCLDEAALVRALEEGKIAGAALDVFETEPLPQQSALWSVPNLIVTPHLGGFSDIYHEQALPIVAANLADYAAGGVTALKDRIR